MQSMANYAFIEAEPGEEAKLLKHDPRELLTIPTPITNKIVGYVLGDLEDECKTIKLDNGAGRFELLRPYSINKRWRQLYGQDILMSRRYKFETTSTSKRGFCGGLRNLERLLHTKHNVSAHPTRDGRFRFGEKIFGKIRIIFDSDEAVTLQDVRYNLPTLLQATLPLSGDWEVVTILQHPRDDGDELESTTSLAKLRLDALKAWPPYSIDPAGTCPAIWVIGLNQVVEIRKSTKTWFDDDTIWEDEQSNEENLGRETEIEEVKHRDGEDGCRYNCHDDTCVYPRVPWYGGFREAFRYIWWQTKRGHRAK
jgi:hypothetical protein